MGNVWQYILTKYAVRLAAFSRNVLLDWMHKQPAEFKGVCSAQLKGNLVLITYILPIFLSISCSKSTNV